jgi:hypothetical protein
MHLLAMSFAYRSMKKWSEGGAVARLSSRLHKIKGALRTQPMEGHVYDTDSPLDLSETEFVSTWLYIFYISLCMCCSTITADLLLWVVCTKRMK